MVIRHRAQILYKIEAFLQSNLQFSLPQMPLKCHCNTEIHSTSHGSSTTINQSIGGFRMVLDITFLTFPWYIIEHFV